MASNEEEIEDLTTCSVCFLEYDDGRRKPKFLQCFHTVCLHCLEQLCKDGHILCPLCRSPTPCPQGVTRLRNNPHAYHMAEMRKKLDGPIRQRAWCLTCAGAADSECTASHETVEIPPKEPSGGRELQSAINEYKRILAENIEKRRGVQQDFQDVLSHLKNFESTVQSQAEDNEIKLAELMSALESADKRSSPNETFKLMKTRVAESTAEKCRELSDLSDKLRNLETENKMRVKIHLEALDKQTVATLPLFENGFCKSADGVDKEDRHQVSLISHLIFSVLRRHNVPVGPQAAPEAPEHSNTSPSVPKHGQQPVDPRPVRPRPARPQTMRQRPNRPPREMRTRAHEAAQMEPSEQSMLLLGARAIHNAATYIKGLKIAQRPLPVFISQHSTFVLKIHEGGSFIGDVCIKPSADFDQNFVKYLGDRCLSLTTFHSQIVKAVRESHVTLNFAHSELTPPVPVWSNRRPGKALEIGLAQLVTENDRVTKWELVFLMQQFKSNELPSSCLFGHIVQGEHVIRSLSLSSENRKLAVVWQVSNSF